MRRFFAQRARTGEWLGDVPIDAQPISELSGPGSLRTTITAELAGLTATDGALVLDPWGTFLYEEQDGEIRWGGIVTYSEWRGAAWSLEAKGFSTYPYGISYFGEPIAAVRADPADLVRRIWSHLSGYADGLKGVEVRGVTPVRLGTASDQRVAEAQAAVEVAKAGLETARAVLAAARVVLKDRQAAVEDVNRRAAAAVKAVKGKDAKDAVRATWVAPKAAAVAARDAQKATVKTRQNERDAAEERRIQQNDMLGFAKEQAREDGGAYKLSWEDATDCGSEIDALATEGKFDWVERHRWNADRTAIEHTIDIAYPRAGRVRDDVVFEQGVNIVGPLEPRFLGAEFANSFIGIGAGEGTQAVRRSLAVRDERLRRTANIARKDIANAPRFDALLRAEHVARRNPLTIPSIRIRNHPHAQFGAFGLGDDVMVRGNIPHLGRIALRHRIVAMQPVTDSVADLTLERSEAFTYGV